MIVENNADSVVKNALESLLREGGTFAVVRRTQVFARLLTVLLRHRLIPLLAHASCRIRVVAQIHLGTHEKEGNTLGVVLDLCGEGWAGAGLVSKTCAPMKLPSQPYPRCRGGAARTPQDGGGSPRSTARGSTARAAGCRCAEAAKLTRKPLGEHVLVGRRPRSTRGRRPSAGTTAASGDRSPPDRLCPKGPG